MAPDLFSNPSDEMFLTRESKEFLKRKCVFASELDDQLFMRHGDNENTLIPTEEKYEEVENRSTINKPACSFWTSTLTPDKPDPSDWIRFCETKAGFLSGRYTWKIRPVKELVVFEIEDLTDYEFLRRSFSRSIEASAFGNQMIDFEKLALFIDGLRVTKDMLGHSELKSWDAESTVWFTYPVADKEFLGYYKHGRFWKTEV